MQNYLHINCLPFGVMLEDVKEGVPLRIEALGQGRLEIRPGENVTGNDPLEAV
jgi:hypothetical protein